MDRLGTMSYNKHNCSHRREGVQMRMGYRQPVTGLLLAALLVAASGCKTETEPVSAGATTPSPESTLGASIGTAGTGDAPDTSAAGAPAGGAGSGPERCTIDHLKVSTASAGGAAGHWGTILLFKNTGSSVCKLQGYPGVAGLDGNGKQVTQAKRVLNGYIGGTESKAPERIDIASGETVSAVVEGTNVPEGDATDCPTYQGLLVTPPDETHSVRFSVGGRGCSGLEVHPVVRGQTGRNG